MNDLMGLGSAPFAFLSFQTFALEIVCLRKLLLASWTAEVVAVVIHLVLRTLLERSGLGGRGLQLLYLISLLKEFSQDSLVLNLEGVCDLSLFTLSPSGVMLMTRLKDPLRVVRRFTDVLDVLGVRTGSRDISFDVFFVRLRVRGGRVGRYFGLRFS